MGRFSFGIKDYRIIRQAKIDPEGITLIYGANGNGKSTIIKALVSLLSNHHSDDNFRHGQTAYAIAARIGDNKLIYTRNGDVSSVKFNDEGERLKLGKSPMNQVEPRFTLKRYDCEEDNFFPNFSFQNSVPIFGDISIYSLFGVMFASIAKVSDRVTSCRSACLATSKKKDASLTSSEMLKKKVEEYSKAVDNLKGRYPNLDADYVFLRSLAEKKQKIDAFMQEYSGLMASCGNVHKRHLADLYDDAKPLFPSMMLVQKVQGVIEQLKVLGDSLQSVKKELGVLPDVGKNVSRLVSMIGTAFRLTGELFVVRDEINTVPNVSLSLLNGAVHFISLNQKLGAIEVSPFVDVSLIEMVSRICGLKKQLAKLKPEAAIVSNEYAGVHSRLSVLPCDRYSEGLCPFAYKFASLGEVYGSNSA
jgi:energy-coupling factor transporter ATP-binding protein EcfA2